MGQYIKDKEMELKTVSDFDLAAEERMRRLDWYSFNFHILALLKRQESMNSDV